MAMLTMPVLIFVRIGLRGVQLEARASSDKTSQEARRSARLELFVSPHFWIICIFNIAFLAYLWGINGWLPGYLIKGKGIHLEHAGWLSSMPFIAMLLGEMIGACCPTASIGAPPPALFPWQARVSPGGSDAFHHAAAGNRGDEL